MTPEQFIEDLKQDYIKEYLSALNTDWSGGDSGFQHTKMDYINSLLMRLDQPPMWIKHEYDKKSGTYNFIDINTSTRISFDR
jgi:hypothetical protein